jgi:hypothetical protein
MLVVSGLFSGLCLCCGLNRLNELLHGFSFIVLDKIKTVFSIFRYTRKIPRLRQVLHFTHCAYVKLGISQNAHHVLLCAFPVLPGFALQWNDHTKPVEIVSVFAMRVGGISNVTYLSLG